ncbi:hypothetical protein K2173_024678 [Erythroxylum novogranatense]|uniref:Uncharacterized protein n=1 Tax=Erythroxylum novogranatense TaxID=1862640 RepID=A0AAV8SV11_9ROSI|nr:hypothetical protein K2173_024678 [Erythroxylum novogranatense]
MNQQSITTILLAILNPKKKKRKKKTRRGMTLAVIVRPSFSSIKLESDGHDGSRTRSGSKTLPVLSLSTPSWVVRTESFVPKEGRRKPDPPCVVCKGTGRVDCYHCSGKGRTNHAHLTMLPKGEWPKWCRTCGGSGLSYCSRCLGTGEYRYIMGFRFMNTDTHNHDAKQYQSRSRTVGGLPHKEQPRSGHNT